ncbi:MAG: phosphate/phosphite/phosphonate ABC transporter substrate-binding protein [Candidatus Riflebacteria bacterium]|nr:phosphate/phosphite/phosphonate ABC transporter substrate-binding protein [Candidatus Riflebacteria bacterium]
MSWLVRVGLIVLAMAWGGCTSAPPPPTPPGPAGNPATAGSEAPAAAGAAGAPAGPTAPTGVPAPGGSRVLVIGNIPSENVLDKSSRYVPLCRYLGERIGATVRFKFEPDYDTIVKGMKKREYDFVMPGSLGYVKGQPAGYRAILAPVSRAPFYQGSIITRTDSGIATLSALAGKKICFCDKGSTSGYLYPMVLLREHGLVAGRDFTPGFVKGHDNVALNVFLRQYDAGACYDGAHREAFKTEPEKAAQLQVIALTDRIYNSPLAARDDLDPALVASFVATFRGLASSPEGLEVLNVLGTNLTGYVEVVDSDYDGVRKMLQYELAQEEKK